MKKVTIKTNKLDLLRPTKMDPWIKYGAGEAGVCLENGLPNWMELPLDQKLPVVLKPKSIAFTRGTAGQNLLPHEKISEFRLNDPYAQVTILDYDSLHDPHLKRYLKKKSTVKQLLDHGTIKADGSAICNLKEFNQYRKFRKFMNLEHVHRQMRQMDNEKEERRRLQQIESNMKKEREKRALKQKYENMGQELQKERQRMKRERWLHNEQVKAEQMQKMRDMKKFEQDEKKIQSAQRDEKIQQKIDRLKEQQHKEQIVLIKNLRQKEENWKNQKDNINRERIENHAKKVEEKWENKKQQMIQKNIAAQKILSEVEKQFLANVEKRKAMAANAKSKQERKTLTIAKPPSILKPRNPPLVKFKN